MIRDEYVDKEGVVVDQLSKDKKRMKMILVALGIILIVIIVYMIFQNIIRNNYCNNIVNKVAKSSLDYAGESKLLPSSEGDYTTFSLETLLKEKKLTEQDVTVNKKVATGKIKVTKYKKDYIVTVELADCDYCDSSKKNWSKESSKKPNSKIIDVIAYYNYYNKTSNETKWTDWFTNDKLNENISKKYKIRLPKENSHLPKIAPDAEIVAIDQETKEFFHYRDKKWKFYSGGGNYTDYFSSEQPSGYTNYDKSTAIYTEWSPFSLDYPDKKEYRYIETVTGYKWYKKVNGKEVYYENGKYCVASEVPKEYIKETKSNTPMYRYRDQQWRWYTGPARKYSSYSSTAIKGYPTKDEGLVTYGGYSGWKEASSLSASNSSYREEETDTRYRYKIRYNVYSLAILKKPVQKEELEKQLKQNIDDILKREDLKVEITYKFIAKK